MTRQWVKCWCQVQREFNMILMTLYDDIADPEYKLNQQQQQILQHNHQQRRSPANTHLNPKKRASPKSSPVRRPRGETKKCRKVSSLQTSRGNTFGIVFGFWHWLLMSLIWYLKVYGMDRRDMWCTQCKWKKACTRFGDWKLYVLRWYKTLIRDDTKSRWKSSKQENYTCVDW